MLCIKTNSQKSLSERSGYLKRGCLKTKLLKFREILMVGIKKLLDLSSRYPKTEPIFPEMSVLPVRESDSCQSFLRANFRFCLSSSLIFLFIPAFLRLLIFRRKISLLNSCFYLFSLWRKRTCGCDCNYVRSLI